MKIMRVTMMKIPKIYKQFIQTYFPILRFFYFNGQIDEIALKSKSYIEPNTKIWYNSIVVKTCTQAFDTNKGAVR